MNESLTLNEIWLAQQQRLSEALIEAVQTVGKIKPKDYQQSYVDVLSRTQYAANDRIRHCMTAATKAANELLQTSSLLAATMPKPTPTATTKRRRA